MKKKYSALILAALLAASSLAGCGGSAPSQATTAASSAEQTTAAAEQTTAAAEAASADTIRVGSLKGPTTIGLVNLMEKSEKGEAEGNYEFTMAAAPDEISSAFAAGSYDIALLPSNLGSVLYNKTNGGVSVIDINTLGVLYCVTGDESVKSVKDLSGKTVYSTGEGATPEYSLRYLLDQNGITDCTMEFRSEPTEIAAMLKEDPSGIAILPQPFVTAAEKQNESLKTAFSLTDEWKQASNGESALITGITLVRNDFLKNHKEAVDTFLKEHAESAAEAVSDVDKTAELVVKQGIIEKEPIAKLAIPECNIVSISGSEMKKDLSGYLQTLYDQNPKAVGGNMPGDDFYYGAD